MLLAMHGPLSSLVITQHTMILTICLAEITHQDVLESWPQCAAGQKSNRKVYAFRGVGHGTLHINAPD